MKTNIDIFTAVKTSNLMSQVCYVLTNERIVKHTELKNVKGSGCDILQGVVPAFAWRNQAKPQETHSLCSRFHDRDTNRFPRDTKTNRSDAIFGRMDVTVE